MTRYLPPDPWVGAACKATPDQLRKEPDYAYPKGAGRARHWKEIEFVNKNCKPGQENQCPVLDYCKQVGKNQEYGIWGGTTEKDRENTSFVLKMFG